MSLPTRDEPEGLGSSEPGRDDFGALRARILTEPDAVLDDPEIMAALLRRADERGDVGKGRKIVDLRSALIDRLEGRLERLRRAHRDVVEAALDNLNGVEKAHEAVLALLDNDGADSLAARIRGRLPSLLRLDEARLCLSIDDAYPDRLRAAARRSPTPAETPSLAIRLRRRIARLIAGDRRAADAAPSVEDDPLDPALVLLPSEAILSRSPQLRGQPDDLAAGARRPVAIDIREVERADRMLLGPAAEKLSHIAVIALDLGPTRSAGALVFGAAEPERLESSHTIDLLAFLGGVVERLIRAEDAPDPSRAAP